MENDAASLNKRTQKKASVAYLEDPFLDPITKEIMVSKSIISDFYVLLNLQFRGEREKKSKILKSKKKKIHTQNQSIVVFFFTHRSMLSLHLMAIHLAWNPFPNGSPKIIPVPLLGTRSSCLI